ncbi:hypothetical protein PG995_015918 [Apiospora arundinis]
MDGPPPPAGGTSVEPGTWLPVCKTFLIVKHNESVPVCQYLQDGMDPELPAAMCCCKRKEHASMCHSPTSKHIKVEGASAIRGNMGWPEHVPLTAEPRRGQQTEATKSTQAAGGRTGPLVSARQQVLAMDFDAVTAKEEEPLLGLDSGPLVHAHLLQNLLDARHRC